MGRKKSSRTVFTVVLRDSEVRVRKALAPAGRPMPDKRLRPPRTRPDHLADE